MRRTILFLILLLTATVGAAQDFEGVIEAKRMVMGDSMNFVYTVKGDQVRVDEISMRTHVFAGSRLFNLKEGTQVILFHQNKKWQKAIDLPKAATPANLQATSLKETKSFFGYKCSKYLVKNTISNISIQFFVAEEKFNFYLPMLKLINNNDEFSLGYMALGVKSGSFPFLAIKYDAAGKEAGRFEVTRIEKKQISASGFEIPKGYSEK